jgi:hypothetical protein
MAYNPANTPESPLKEMNRDERSINCRISVSVSNGDGLICFIEKYFVMQSKEHF